MRTAACLGLPVDLILPTGFDASDRAFRRAGMDYLAHLDITRHPDWQSFLNHRDELGSRLVLLTVSADVPYTSFKFRDTDILLLGRESAGVPEAVHSVVDGRIKIPIRSGLRSLNVAVAMAMVVGEAMRQTGLQPDPASQ